MPWLEGLKFLRGYQMGTHKINLASFKALKYISLFNNTFSFDTYIGITVPFFKVNYIPTYIIGSIAPAINVVWPSIVCVNGFFFSLKLAS